MGLDFPAGITPKIRAGRIGCTQCTFYTIKFPGCRRRHSVEEHAYHHRRGKNEKKGRRVDRATSCGQRAAHNNGDREEWRHYFFFVHHSERPRALYGKVASGTRMRGTQRWDRKAPSSTHGGATEEIDILWLGDPGPTTSGRPHSETNWAEQSWGGRP
ncbi:hypothetical protein MRX96_014293 [Rhipicephalus microplus]